MQRRKASEEESEAGVSVQDVHRNSCCWQYQSLFARICREHDKSYTKALVSNHIFFVRLDQVKLQFPAFPSSVPRHLQ